MWGVEQEASLARGWFFDKILWIFLFTASLEAELPSKEVLQEVAPYLIPENHPIKASLDNLFQSSRVILNLKSLRKAGFSKTKPRKFTKLLVTKHPDFPGYVFKLYLDAQRYYKNVPEHRLWIQRIQGAKRIREEIAKRGWEGSFVVPTKWIYALPENPKIKKGYVLKHFILVEDDMDLYSDKENARLWASDFVSEEKLLQLFEILETIGLHDCVKPDNIPFTKSGKIAFIDTQTFGKEVPYRRLKPHLSKTNGRFWKALTH